MVDDELDIEDLHEEASDVLDETGVLKTRKARSVGYKALIMASFIAALLGTLGGAMASKFTKPSISDLRPVTSKIENVISENKALKAQLSRLERDLKVKPETAKIDLSGITSRLSALETSLAQVIDTSSPTLDSDLVARLEALQEDGSQALDLSDILQRLDKVETMSSQIVAVPERDQNDLREQLKIDILADDSFLQNVVGNINGAEPSSVKLQGVVDKTKLLPLPKTEMLSALDETFATESWLKRTLNKHITVQSEDNPRYLVELIERDLQDENFSEALVKFDKLPEPVKVIAKNWRDAFEDHK